MDDRYFVAFYRFYRLVWRQRCACVQRSRVREGMGEPGLGGWENRVQEVGRRGMKETNVRSNSSCTRNLVDRLTSL